MAIIPQLKKWNQENKERLFAGIAFGTEVSLNATIEEGGPFKVYGYRGVQDLVCSADKPDCFADTPPSPKDLKIYRQKVVQQYLTDLSRQAVLLGLPKQRLYTHVWAEVEAEETEKYVNYFAAAQNIYSRPGLSLYNYSSTPFNLTVLDYQLQLTGEPRWGAPEFSTDGLSASDAFQETLANQRNPAQLINIYNWREIRDSDIVPVLSDFMKKTPITPSCIISEVLPKKTDKNNIIIRSLLDPEDNGQSETIYIARSVSDLENKKYLYSETFKANSDRTASYEIFYPDLKENIYYWQIKRLGCDGKKWTSSVPEVLKVKEIDWFNKVRISFYRYFRQKI